MQVFSQNTSKLLQSPWSINYFSGVLYSAYSIFKVLKPSNYLQGIWGCVVRGWGAVAQETERAALQSKDPWLLQSTY